MMSFKIILLKLTPHIPGANEFKFMCAYDKIKTLFALEQMTVNNIVIFKGVVSLAEWTRRSLSKIMLHLNYGFIENVQQCIISLVLTSSIRVTS